MRWSISATSCGRASPPTKNSGCSPPVPRSAPRSRPRRLNLKRPAAAKLKGFGVKIVEDVDKKSFAMLSDPYLDKLAKELGPACGEDQEPDPGESIRILRVRRPGERRDPYARGPSAGQLDRDLFSNNKRRWLWIPGRSPGRRESLSRDDEKVKMSISDKLVLQRQHHLKWQAFDKLETDSDDPLRRVVFSGFSLSVTCDNRHAGR